MAEVSDRYPDVFQYIISEENAFKTNPIPLANNWEWSMYEHIDRSFTLKNSQFTKGANDGKRPFHNIILPIANVNYRSEGFDVKDVEVYVNDKANYYKSFLTRKFHTKWARKYSVDTAIDESVESYFDYGLILVKNVNDKRPEVVQLQQIAFCDQTNVLAGPICLKHQYSISDLVDMKGKWKAEEVDRAINHARFSQQRVGAKETKTSSKYIEVYELHGTFPDEWLEGDDLEIDRGSYSPQIHIVTYYIDHETGQKNGIHLFKGKEPKPIFKAWTRDPIYGRACGRGGIEELFNPQVWTNFSEIHLQQNLEAVSKVVLKTTDPKFAQNNNTTNMKHGQVLTVGDGKDVNQLEVTSPNYVLFEKNYIKWEQLARAIGSASDPQLGLNPTSGTPLGTTEIVTNQGQGIHDYRRGKLSTFWGEIYRDWVLPALVDDMLKGDEWVEELDADELREVVETIAINESNKKIKEAMINKGDLVSVEEQEQMKQLIRENFARKGSRHFLKLVEGELKDIPIDVSFNIAGKQAYQAEMVNKLNSVFRTVFANPQVLQNEGVSELFNKILESAGISPISFAKFMTQPPQQAQQAQQPQPAQAMAPEPVVA